MYVTDAECEMPMLHQTIPLAAVHFEKRDSSDIKLYSRSLVSNVNPDEDLKAYILGQLFYYKCTSGPIQALVIDLKERSYEVRHRL